MRREAASVAVDQQEGGWRRTDYAEFQVDFFAQNKNTQTKQHKLAVPSVMMQGSYRRMRFGLGMIARKRKYRPQLLSVSTEFKSNMSILLLH